MTSQSIELRNKLIHQKRLMDEGFCYVPATEFHLPPYQSFKALWDNLEPDQYLKHNYNFRLRRYGQAIFMPQNGALRPIEAQPYLQSSSINSYAGDVARIFPPLLADFYENAFVTTTVNHSFSMFAVERPYLDKEWIVDFHLFRILAKRKLDGLPTPEGVHQDGFPFGSVHFIQKENVTGGITSIHALDDSKITSFEMKEFFDSTYIFDPRVKHGVSPVLTDTEGFRDVFVMGFYLPNSKYDKPKL